jgi:hypothetical protein
MWIQMIYTQLRAIYTKYKRGREKVKWTENYKHSFPKLNWSILVHNSAAQNIYRNPINFGYIGGVERY